MDQRPDRYRGARAPLGGFGLGKPVDIGELSVLNPALDHLPSSRQCELQRIVRILFEEFEAVLAGGRADWKRGARIGKVILYGSHARGDWVDDPIGGYRSDYDILVVVNDARLTDPVDIWSAAEDRLLREVSIAETISAPVNLIVHDIHDMNWQLERGRAGGGAMMIVAKEWNGHFVVTPDGTPLERRHGLPADALGVGLRRAQQRIAKAMRADAVPNEPVGQSLAAA